MGPNHIGTPGTNLTGKPRRVHRGFKAAAAEELPDAVAVMDPFHVVRLAGEALDQCRRPRVQLATCGHRGYKGDPLYTSRRPLHTGIGLLTDKQTDRLEALFADDAHVEV